jgi:hypothetical protein
MITGVQIYRLDNDGHFGTAIGEQPLYQRVFSSAQVTHQQLPGRFVPQIGIDGGTARSIRTHTPQFELSRRGTGISFD